MRSMEEFELVWQEFFKDKPEPKNDEEDRMQQEEFYHWYNYVRKQSDTGKTPAEMYSETYGKEPPKNPTEVSRMMNFEWDEDYAEEEYEGDDEQQLKELSELADAMFKNGVWQNSKEEVKNMSRKESSRHMFRLGFFTHSKYMDEQMRDFNNKLKNMSEEEIVKRARLLFTL